MAGKNPWSSLLQNPEDRLADLEDSDLLAELVPDASLPNRAPAGKKSKKRGAWQGLLENSGGNFLEDQDSSPEQLLPRGDIAPVRKNDAIAQMLRPTQLRTPGKLVAEPLGPARGAGAQQDLLDLLNLPFPPGRTRAPSSGAQQDLLGTLNRGVSQDAGKLLPPPKPPAPGQEAQARANRAVVASEPGLAPNAPVHLDASSQAKPGLDPGLEAGRLSAELPLAPPRSGMKTMAEEKYASGTDQKHERNHYLGNDEAQALAETVQNLPFIKRQREDADARSGLMKLALMHKSPQPDLSPLAALADSWVQNSRGGGQKSDLLAASQSAAKNRQDGMELLAKLGAQNAKDNQDLTKDQLDAFTKLKSGKDMTDAYEKLGTTASATNADPMARFNPIQANTAFSNLIEKNLGKDTELASEVHNAYDEIHSGNPAAMNNIQLHLAKIVAGGRLAMYEVMKEGGDPSFIEKTLQIGERLKTGGVTEKNVHEYNDFLADMATNYQRTRSLKAARLKEMGVTHFMQDPDMINAALPDSYINAYPPIKKYNDVERKFPKAGAPGAKMTPPEQPAKRGAPSIDDLIKSGAIR